VRDGRAWLVEQASESASEVGVEDGVNDGVQGAVDVAEPDERRHQTRVHCTRAPTVVPRRGRRVPTESIRSCSNVSSACWRRVPDSLRSRLSTAAAKLLESGSDDAPESLAVQDRRHPSPSLPSPSRVALELLRSCRDVAPE